MPCSASSENEKECCEKLDFQLGNLCRDPHVWFRKDAGVWCNISGYYELMITIYFQANKMWVKVHNYMISQPVYQVFAETGLLCWYLYTHRINVGIA